MRAGQGSARRRQHNNNQAESSKTAARAYECKVTSLCEACGRWSPHLAVKRDARTPCQQSRDDGEIHEELKAAVVQNPHHAPCRREEGRGCGAVVVKQHGVCCGVVLRSHDAGREGQVGPVSPQAAHDERGQAARGEDKGKGVGRHSTGHHVGSRRRAASASALCSACNSKGGLTLCRWLRSSGGPLATRPARGRLPPSCATETGQSRRRSEA